MPWLPLLLFAVVAVAWLSFRLIIVKNSRRKSTQLFNTKQRYNKAKMKHSQVRNRRRREAGVALITVLMISVATAMLLGASLCVTLTSSKLGWTQARAEAALQLADAGINSELQYIAQNQGQSMISLKSSQPLAAVGITLQYPGENFTVKGRPGTVAGYTGGQFFVYSSNDAAGTTAWDGVTSPFYITASGYVNKTWQNVIGWATIIILIGLSVTLLVTSFL